MSEYRTITEWLTTGDGRVLTNHHKTQLLEMAAQYEQTILAWQRDALDWQGEYEATVVLVARLARAQRDGSAALNDAIAALIDAHGLHVSNSGVIVRANGGVWQEVGNG